MSEAARLLKHYLRTAWRAAGLKWDSDNDAEVDGLVDDLKGEIKADVMQSIARERGDK